jgi:hypothetical protein
MTGCCPADRGIVPQWVLFNLRIERKLEVPEVAAGRLSRSATRCGLRAPQELASSASR